MLPVEAIDILLIPQHRYAGCAGIGQGVQLVAIDKVISFGGSELLHGLQQGQTIAQRHMIRPGAQQTLHFLPDTRRHPGC